MLEKEQHLNTETSNKGWIPRRSRGGTNQPQADVLLGSHFVYCCPGRHSVVAPA